MEGIYEKLRERLDKFPQGFPKTESGVELEILKTLFSPKEAEIVFLLRPYPEPASMIDRKGGPGRKKWRKIFTGSQKKASFFASDQKDSLILCSRTVSDRDMGIPIEKPKSGKQPVVCEIF